MLPRNVVVEGLDPGCAPSVPEVPAISETDRSKLSSMIEELILSDIERNNAATVLVTDLAAAPCK